MRANILLEAPVARTEEHNVIQLVAAAQQLREEWLIGCGRVRLVAGNFGPLGLRVLDYNDIAAGLQCSLFSL